MSNCKPKGKYRRNNDQLVEEEVFMSALIANQDTQGTVHNREDRPQAKSERNHFFPVARLLGKVAGMQKEYAEYQMNAGIWRRLAL